MKLTEKQAWKVVGFIEEYLGLNIKKEEKADLVMLELINLELGI